MENNKKPSLKDLGEERQNFKDARQKATEVANNGGLKVLAESVAIGDQTFYVVDDSVTVMVVPTNQIS